ncbi:hypothetical protein AGMMS49574_05210 [Bacteroidia bacterium]|nr:hypothetical protein AGMMS49574_05210 [Bacteroidia bacterium]
MEKIKCTVMKKYKYSLWMFISAFLLFSCSDDSVDLTPGNPALEVASQIAGASFGENLSFVVNVTDNVPLSTLTARLFFGDEKVSETVIRTKENGAYDVNLPVPYYKNIPDGIATLELVLIDTHLTAIQKKVDVPVTRPRYPYLILVTVDGSYPMVPTGNPYEYAATEAFPSTDLPAYIKTPAQLTYGNEITFGWDAGQITEGSVGYIPFLSSQGGTYSVTFNTKTYEAAPFFELTINGQRMAMVDKSNFRLDLDITQGEKLTVEGIGNIADWWIDTDFFTKVSDNQFTFTPISGKYRITANTVLQYFIVEVLAGNDVATLQPDGSGALWVIGDAVGKPSLANEVGWNTDKALCLAPIGGNKYQLTVVGGKNIHTESINFKFFHQKGWGSEFSGDNLHTTGKLVFVGTGGDSGRDSGNLGLVAGVTLETDAVYVFTVDISTGTSNATLIVEKQ